MLCRFAADFPPFAATLLERDSRLSRNFREETVTDLVMASLVGLGGYGVIVQFPVEPVTGGDMEWWFIAPRDGSCFRLLIQAKRLYCHRKRRDNWAYDALAHVGPDQRLQADTLTRFAALPPDGVLTWPLYAFYNRSAALEAPVPATAAGGPLPEIEGINLASGYAVAPGVASAEGRKLATLRPHMFSLTDLFCPDPPLRVLRISEPDEDLAFLVAGPAGLPSSPHPGDIVGRLQAVMGTRGSVDGRGPRAGEGIPRHILAAAGFGEPDGRDETLVRPRAIVVHGGGEAPRSEPRGAGS